MDTALAPTECHDAVVSMANPALPALDLGVFELPVVYEIAQGKTSEITESYLVAVGMSSIKFGDGRNGEASARKNRQALGTFLETTNGQ